jgi:hypothetical protein
MTKKLRVIVIEEDVSMGECYRQMINLVPYAGAEAIHDGVDGLRSQVANMRIAIIIT